METDELLRRAWEAVEKSGVPESLQEVAFREAVETLRAESGGEDRGGDRGGKGQTPTGTRSSALKTKKPAPSDSALAEVPDEDTFFSRLADESGLPETDLRDILQLKADGKVQVTPPTRDLGGSLSAQARTVVALVASARSVGLEERPVNAQAVRDEVSRKRCLDKNYARWVIGELRGFNAVGRTEIAITSRWLDEFRAGVDQAHGRSADPSAT